MAPESIRIATVADAGAVAAVYAPYVTETVISFEADPPGEAEMAGRMARIAAACPWLVYDVDGEVLGYAYAGPHAERAAYRWSVDATVYVARPAHRQGIGRALYERLEAILKLQGFHTAYAGITLPNAASVGLHEARGYRPVGVYREVGYKMGAWHDVGWWGLRLGPAASEPASPRPFSEEIFRRATSGVGD